MKKLIKWTMFFLLLSASCVRAISYEARGDIQYPRQGLTDLEFLQGAYVPLKAVLLEDGDAYTNIAGYSATFVYGSSPTSTAFVVSTNTSVDADTGSFTIPVSTGNTSTNGIFWYSVRWYDANTNMFFTGTGRLDIIETTIAGDPSTLTLQSLINWSNAIYQATGTDGPVRLTGAVTATTNSDGSVTYNVADATTSGVQTVTGSADISVTTSGTDRVIFAASTLARGTELVTLSNQLVTAYSAADVTLSNDLTTAYQAAAAVVGLNSSNYTDTVSNNILTAYSAADVTLSNQLETSFASADVTLSNQLVTAYQAADVTLSNDLTTAYQAADVTLSNQLETSFAAADVTLSNNLTTAYQTADNAKLNSAAGTGTNMSLVSDATISGTLTMGDGDDITSNIEFYHEGVSLSSGDPIDHIAGNVSLNTNAPAWRIDVESRSNWDDATGDTAVRLDIEVNGKQGGLVTGLSILSQTGNAYIGIRDETPTEELDVNGDVNVQSNLFLAPLAASTTTNDLLTINNSGEVEAITQSRRPMAIGFFGSINGTDLSLFSNIAFAVTMDDLTVDTFAATNYTAAGDIALSGNNITEVNTITATNIVAAGDIDFGGNKGTNWSALYLGDVPNPVAASVGDISINKTAPRFGLYDSSETDRNLLLVVDNGDAIWHEISTDGLSLTERLKLDLDDGTLTASGEWKLSGNNLSEVSTLTATNTTTDNLTVNTWTGFDGWYTNSASGTNFTINWEDGNLQVIVLTNDMHLSAPSNVKNSTMLLMVQQDGTGTRLLTYDAAYDFGTDGSPTLTTNASQEDVLSFIGRESDKVYGGFKLGFTP